MSAIAQKRSRSAVTVRLRPRLFLRPSLFVIGAIFLWGGWTLTAHSVVVTVDGIGETVKTHRHTVEDLVRDLGLTLQPQDRVEPALETRLSSQIVLNVERARVFRILADGREMLVSSWGASAAAVLADAGMTIDANDRVVIGDRQVKPDEPLPEPVVTLAPRTYARGYGWERVASAPLQLQVHRAVPITVDDGNLPFSIRTTAATVGEALREAEITVYLGDRIQPSLGSQVSAGLRVFIERSIPLALRADSRLIKTRTRAKTVGGALTELKIGVAGADLVTPALTETLTPDMEIAITRVREDVAISDEIIPFDTAFEPDPNLAIDSQQVVNPGAPGITRQRFRVRYENGQQVMRELQDTWVAQEATQRLIAYGQLIEPKTFTAADGSQVTYWRKFRAYASSYSAATAGVPKSSPTYGRTFTGEVMRNGIVAVDPRVIPMGAKIYVPGYGFGDALDRGSAVIGRHIDLGYADDELVFWARWVDVYLLWPPPSTYQITWVLPNYPRQPE